MKIELITREDYEILFNIQKTHPILTFQNEGYQYIDKSKFTEDDKKSFDIITEILSKHIIGFSQFFNFKLTKKTKEILLRFDYNYGEEDNNMSFTGVGYIFLDELLNGFK